MTDGQIQVDPEYSMPLAYYRTRRKVHALCVWTGLVGLVAAQGSVLLGVRIALITLLAYAAFWLVERIRSRRALMGAFGLLHQVRSGLASDSRPTTSVVDVRIDAHTFLTLRSSERAVAWPALFGLHEFVPGPFVLGTCLCAVLLNERSLNRSFPLHLIHPLAGDVIAKTLTVVLAGSAAYWHLHPGKLGAWYFRCSPGLLEGLVSKVYATTVNLVVEVPLSGASIRLRGVELGIDYRLAGQPHSLTLDLREIDEPVEFMRALLAAAGEERGSAPLPTSTLVG